MANTTIRRVAAVGTMAAAGVGVLAGTAAGTASANEYHPGPPPRDNHHPDWKRDCHVEWKKTYERGHYVPGHYVHGHWERDRHGHGHYVHGYYQHGYWVPGHKVVKPEVVCDIWGSHHDDGHKKQH